MRSTTSSTSSMTTPEGAGRGGGKKRLAGGQEARPGTGAGRKSAGLQSSILQAILVDPLPIATTPTRNLTMSSTSHRPPSISIANDENDGGKENGARGRLKDRSRPVDDDEVFEILTTGAGGKHDPDQVDVTMSDPLTPSAGELTLLAPGVERTLGAIKNASSFLDVSSASTTSIFNRSTRPKSIALEELPEEWRPWLRACTDGDIEKARGLLKREPTLLNWSPPLTARLAGLHLAVRGAHLAMVIWMVQTGADVNQQSLSGYTPLHIAAQATDRGMVNELLRLGADASRRDVFGRRYDHYASWAREGRSRSGKLHAKDSFHSTASSYDSRHRSRSVHHRSRPPSVYSRDSMASAASSFGRHSSIRHTVCGFFRNTFRKAPSAEKLHL